MKVITVKFFLAFFLMVQSLWALNPHVDEVAYYLERGQVRKLSSVSIEKCESNRSFGCVDYVNILSNDVVRVSLKGFKQYFFDVRVSDNCSDKEALLERASRIELKNVHLDKAFSARADIYINGKSLKSLCTHKN